MNKGFNLNQVNEVFINKPHRSRDFKYEKPLKIFGFTVCRAQYLYTKSDTLRFDRLEDAVKANPDIYYMDKGKLMENPSVEIVFSSGMRRKLYFDTMAQAKRAFDFITHQKGVNFFHVKDYQTYV